VTVYSLPELIVNDIAVCYDSTAVLTVSSKDAVSYRWCSDANYKNTIINAASFETPALESDTVFYIEVVSPHGCISRDTVRVTVYPLTDLSVQDTIVCYGSTITLTASSTNAVSFGWYSDAAHTNLVGQGATFQTNVLTADIKLYVKATSVNGCSSYSAIVVFVSSHLTSVITPDTCNKSIGQIALTITSDHPTTIVCTWEGLSDTSRVLVGLEGNKTYSVVVTDSLCLERGVFLVPMISGPIADFLSNNDIPVGTQLILTDISQGSIVRRDWDFGDDTKDTFTNKVVFHTYAAMGYYPVTLIVTDTNNCMDSVSKTIRVSEDIRVYIPNIFTPNGDGINDTWGPVMSGFRSEGYLLSVFDRWGSTVYKSTNPLEKWDGSIRGSHIQGNIVYTYRLIVRDMLNVEHEYIGSVTVVR
jgi:gliding motility-associated-like protein